MFNIKKTFARWGSMLKAYLYALFPPASGASWGILNRYWLDPDKNGQVTQMFRQFSQAS